MSFDNLVREYGAQVLRTATRVLHDASLAHDVHQEVFLSIWRRWHRYNGNVNWPAYLYRATVRKALQAAQHRSVRGRPARASEERVEGVPPSNRGQDARDTTPHGVTTNGPESNLQAEELQRKLVAALARLPRRQADAFVLARLEGLEAAAIGGILGCSEPTVRVHLHRAMQRLARELRPYLSR